MSEQAEQSVRLRMDIPIEMDRPFPLAQSMWANHDSDHVYLRFFQIVPPLTVAELPDSVQAQPVAIVAIPALRLPAIIGALTKQAHAFEESTGKSLDWSDEGLVISPETAEESPEEDPC